VKKTAVKLIKIFTAIIISAAILTAGGLATLRYFFSEEKIKEILISEGSALLKRKIEIENLRYGLGGVVLSGAALYDGTAGDSPAIIKAEEISLGFSLFDLINRKLNIKDISIKSPELMVVFDAANKTNIQKLIDEVSQTGGEKKSISADVSRINLADAKILIIEPKENFAPLAGEYIISAEIDLKDAISISNCTLELPENRGLINPNISISSTGGSVIIAGSVRLNPASLLWVYKWAPPSNHPPYLLVNGNVDGLKIEITPDKNVIIEGHAVVSSTLSNSQYGVTADGYCRVNVKQRNINIWNISGKIDSSSFFLKSLLFSFSGQLSSFDAKNLSVDIGHARALLNFIPAKLFGSVKGGIAYANGKFSGEMSVAHAGYDRGMIKGITTDISINENIIKKTGIPVNIFGNNCVASVATTDASMKRIFIDIKGQNFVIKDSAAQEGEQPTQPRPSNVNSIIPLSINGRIDLASIQYGKINLGETSINYSLSDGLLTIQRLSTNFMQGNIGAEGSISLKGAQPAASAAIRFDRVMLQNIASLNPDFQNRIYGFMSGGGRLNFFIGNNLLDSLKGNIRFQIDRGKIVNTGIQNGLGIWLSELKYKLTDLEFNTINGEIDISGRNYIINRFIFDSENIRLKLHGSMNGDFETSGMDISLELTPRFIQDIPAIAFGLKNRKEGDWYIIPFTGSGKITEGKNIKMVK
jgi:uncharacterized protein involved in outer membrane biogenesis